MMSAGDNACKGLNGEALRTCRDLATICDDYAKTHGEDGWNNFALPVPTDDVAESVYSHAGCRATAFSIARYSGAVDRGTIRLFREQRGLDQSPPAVPVAAPAGLPAAPPAPTPAAPPPPVAPVPAPVVPVVAPGDIRFAIDRARILFSQEKWMDIVTLLEPIVPIIAEHTAFGNGLFYLAHAQHELGNHREAVALYEKYRTWGGGGHDPLAAAMLADSYARLQRPLSARDLLMNFPGSLAVELRQRVMPIAAKIEVLRDKATLAEVSQDVDNVLRLRSEALALASGEPELQREFDSAVRAAVNEAIDAGKVDQALDVYRGVIASAVRQPQHYRDMADILWRWKRDAEAIKILRSLLDQKAIPLDKATLSRIGFDLLTRKAEYTTDIDLKVAQETAVIAFERCTQLDPHDADCDRQLGDALDGLKRDAEAIEAYERALELYKKDPRQYNGHLIEHIEESLKRLRRNL